MLDSNEIFKHNKRYLVVSRKTDANRYEHFDPISNEWVKELEPRCLLYGKIKTKGDVEKLLAERHIDPKSVEIGIIEPEPMFEY